MSLLYEIFTWWNGQTVGTRFWTWRYGQRVGEDASGNVYYRSADGKRWVIYNGEAEASRIPPEWHGWLHQTWDQPPNEQEPAPRRPWEKEHRPNLTGTPEAYHPPGSILSPERRPRVGSDYEAWTPD